MKNHSLRIAACSAAFGGKNGAERHCVVREMKKAGPLSATLCASAGFIWLVRAVYGVGYRASVRVQIHLQKIATGRRYHEPELVALSHVPRLVRIAISDLEPTVDHEPQHRDRFRAQQRNQQTVAAAHQILSLNVEARRRGRLCYLRPSRGRRYNDHHHSKEGFSHLRSLLR